MQRMFLLLMPFLLVLGACKEVVFDQAQPGATAVRYSFPTEFQGNFAVLESGINTDRQVDFIKIEAQHFTLFERQQMSTTRKEIDLDPYLEIRGEYIYRLDSEIDQGYLYATRGDSLFYEAFFPQKMSLGDSLILKQKAGYTLLNILQDQGYWVCMLLERERDGDVACWLIDGDSEQEKALMKKHFQGAILALEQDDYLLQPSRKQFLRYLDAGGFTYQLYRLIQTEKGLFPVTLDVLKAH